MNPYVRTENVIPRIPTVAHDLKIHCVCCGDIVRLLPCHVDLLFDRANDNESYRREAAIVRPGYRLAGEHFELPPTGAGD